MVAADSRDSSFSILSMRCMVPLARISSTMAIDSASDTGPDPVVITLGESATGGDPNVTPGPGRGESPGSAAAASPWEEPCSIAWAVESLIVAPQV